MTLASLIEKFEEANQGKARKTRQTNGSIIKIFKETWKHGLNIHVSQIRSSQLNGWLASQKSRLKNSTYNRYAAFLKQLFDIALADKAIAKDENPYNGVKTKWKRPQKPERNIPTSAQFEAIVASIRSQQFSHSAKETADFVEFLGRAGLGQAEARSLTWGDLEWAEQRLNV